MAKLCAIYGLISQLIVSVNDPSAVKIVVSCRCFEVPMAGSHGWTRTCAVAGAPFQVPLSFSHALGTLNAGPLIVTHQQF